MSTKAQSDIVLRSVGPDDHEFLVEVYASTRAEELARTQWTSEQREGFVRMQFAAQQDHYAKTYPAGNHDIILSNGRPVGRLYVGRMDHEIRIADITLLPAERNAGIGTYLIKQLLDEAKRTGKVTTIWVEDFNPSLRLFQRLGFSLNEQQGFHCLMEWSDTNSAKNSAD